MFHSTSLVLLALILQVDAIVAPGSVPPIVDLGYAQYQGAFNSTAGTTEFQSIRYAAPPIGTLKTPRPDAPRAHIDDWHGL
jgi:hypothetical protein